MLARIQSFILSGIDAQPCEIEVDVGEAGMSNEQIVGLANAAVKESMDRVRAAILNTGYRFPQNRILVNLAPADVRKEEPVYDLPIAIGMLTADGSISRTRCEREGGLDPRAHLFAGELALDGRIRPIRGALSVAALARKRGLKGVVVPAENAPEASVVEGVDVYGVQTLAEAVALIHAEIPREPVPPADVRGLIQLTNADIDFAEVKGQEGVKRAMTVAAAGMHNILMLGPAGTGKTMMARALPGILPSLSPQEAVEITRIYSAAGRLNGSTAAGLITKRPVRTPHHTASAIAVIGGGKVPAPGEISMAHQGVLFLDELPEFPRAVLDTLRQPLESGDVTISRAHSSASFPANFMLVAAMNPTASGEMPANETGRREMKRYLGRISRPLIDRIDIHVEAPAVPWKDLSATDRKPGTSTAQMRDRVASARERQRARQGETLNARLRGKDLDTLAPMTDDARAMLGGALTELGLSARAYDKIRRVARTIADIDAAETIDIAHIAEAIQYRLLDREGV